MTSRILVCVGSNIIHRLPFRSPLTDENRRVVGRQGILPLHGQYQRQRERNYRQGTVFVHWVVPVCFRAVSTRIPGTLSFTTTGRGLYTSYSWTSFLGPRRPLVEREVYRSWSNSYSGRFSFYFDSLTVPGV